MRQLKLVFWIPRLALFLLSMYIFVDSVSVLIDEDNYRIYDGFGDAIMSLLYTAITIVCLLLLLFYRYTADLLAAAVLLVALLLSITIPNAGRFYLLSITTFFYLIYVLMRFRFGQVPGRRR